MRADYLQGPGLSLHTKRRSSAYSLCLHRGITNDAIFDVVMVWLWQGGSKGSSVPAWNKL